MPIKYLREGAYGGRAGTVISLQSTHIVTPPRLGKFTRTSNLKVSKHWVAMPAEDVTYALFLMADIAAADFYHESPLVRFIFLVRLIP